MENERHTNARHSGQLTGIIIIYFGRFFNPQNGWMLNSKLNIKCKVNFIRYVFPRNEIPTNNNSNKGAVDRRWRHRRNSIALEKWCFFGPSINRPMWLYGMEAVIYANRSFDIRCHDLTSVWTRRNGRVNDTIYTYTHTLALAFDWWVSSSRMVRYTHTRPQIRTHTHTLSTSSSSLHKSIDCCMACSFGCARGSPPNARGAEKMSK